MSVRNILDGTIKVAMGGGGSSSGGGGAEAFTYQHLNDNVELDMTNVSSVRLLQPAPVDRWLYHLTPNVHFVSIKTEVAGLTNAITQMKINTGLDSELGLETLASTVVNANNFANTKVIITEENKKIVCYLYLVPEEALAVDNKFTYKINMTIPIISSIN